MIFLLVFSIKFADKPTDSISPTKDFDLSLNLETLLKTPVELDNNYLTIYQALFYWDSKPSKYKEGVKLELKKILSVMESYYKDIYDKDKLKDCYSTYELIIERKSLLSWKRDLVVKSPRFSSGTVKACYEDELKKRLNLREIEKSLSFNGREIKIKVYNKQIRAD